jgi:hypothetical protein
MNLANVYISNSNPDQPGMEKAYEFANSEEQNTQKTITHGTEKAFSMSVTLTAGGKVGIPLLAEGEVSAAIETGFQMSTMKSESMTSSDTKTLSWKESGTLKPGHAVHCTSWAARGFFNSEYTAVVEVTTVDRKTFQFEQPGRANSISWTEASSNCMDIPLADVPKVPHGQEQKFEAGKENPKPMEPVHRDGPPNTEQQKKTEEPTPNTGAEQPATENTQ